MIPSPVLSVTDVRDDNLSLLERALYWVSFGLGFDFSDNIDICKFGFRSSPKVWVMRLMKMYGYRRGSPIF